VNIPFSALISLATVCKERAATGVEFTTIRRISSPPERSTNQEAKMPIKLRQTHSDHSKTYEAVRLSHIGGQGRPAELIFHT
jgi:hypothetical protein